MFCSTCSTTIIYDIIHLTMLYSISYLFSWLLEGPSQGFFGVWFQTSNRNPSMLDFPKYPFAIQVYPVLEVAVASFSSDPVPGSVHVTELVRCCARARQFVVCCRRRSWWLGHRGRVEGDAIHQTVHKEWNLGYSAISFSPILSRTQVPSIRYYFCV